MSLTLKIVSRHRQTLGEKGVMTFGQDGGTIGRSLETDWPLPDAQRFLSGRHASIDFRSGSYYIVDTSRNGVYINDAEQPVGRGKPQRLFPGDRIRIGDYEMTVAIENVDDTRESLLSTSHIDPVDVKQRVEAPEPTGHDLVDAYAITGVGIEMYLEEDDATSLKPLYEKYRTGESSSRMEAPSAPPEPRARSAPAPAAPQQPVASGQPAAPTRPAARGKPAATTAPAPPRAGLELELELESEPAKAPALAPAKTTAAAPKPVKPLHGRRAEAGNPLDAFFRGAGINTPELSAKQTEQMLTQLGQVTRELIVGVIDCLHLRALQKAQLKQSNTTIQARENNRLKFSANVEEGFQRLLLDESDQYMSPVESVRSSISDLKAHQRALMAATRQALDEYLDRLEPEQIEHRSTGRAGALINVANKHRYWDLYKDVYAILANRPADELPQPFLDALAKYYELAIAKSQGKTPAEAHQEAS
jgi:type VI secretion system FHA domain protein